MGTQLGLWWWWAQPYWDCSQYVDVGPWELAKQSLAVLTVSWKSCGTGWGRGNGVAPETQSMSEQPKLGSEWNKVCFKGFNKYWFSQIKSSFSFLSPPSGHLTRSYCPAQMVRGRVRAPPRLLPSACRTAVACWACTGWVHLFVRHRPYFNTKAEPVGWWGGWAWVVILLPEVWSSSEEKDGSPDWLPHVGVPCRPTHCTAGTRTAFDSKLCLYIQQKPRYKQTLWCSSEAFSLKEPKPEGISISGVRSPVTLHRTVCSLSPLKRPQKKKSQKPLKYSWVSDFHFSVHDRQTDILDWESSYFAKGSREQKENPSCVCVCAGMLPGEPGGWGRGTQRFQHVYVHTATACPVKLAGISPNFGGVWKYWGRGSNSKIPPCQKVWECHIKGQPWYYPFH